MCFPNATGKTRVVSCCITITAAEEKLEESELKETRMREIGVSKNIPGIESRSTGYQEEALKLPQSTHSFLFTEPVDSLPFLFGAGIAIMSYTCLILALINNLKSGKIPTNVDLSVRIAQYLSILIALLMEEEIPTGLNLLRRISKSHLKIEFPEISYYKFACSSVLRITMGYLFLVNVLIVLIQADGVIVIFYDVLALQFIQKLDDIGFSVSKIEVLGKRLQRATMTPYFYANFEKGKESLRLKKRVRMFLKTAYFINFGLFLSAMVVVSVRQLTGKYQCESITVRFGDDVWQSALVQWPSHSKQYPPGLVEELVLVYTYFNGVYAKHSSRTHEGRPVYIEQKKSDRSPFDKATPNYNPYHPGRNTIDSIKPAEIKFCGGRWVFSHEYIRKSKKDKMEETNCQWLARSPETDGFNLLDVGATWQIWAGVIVESDVSIKCNECKDASGCNLNGWCGGDGKCHCDVDHDVVYLGTHCEVKLEQSCRTIIGEQYNDMWSVGTATFPMNASSWMEESTETFQEYSRPVYSYVSGLPEGQAPEKGDALTLIHSGSRWFKINMRGAQNQNASEFWMWMTTNYHAFWARAYEPDVTTLVSDPTYNDSPVGVDFYHVGERGNQFGPFGSLYPAQKNNITGRGYYRCKVEVCSFCSNDVIDKELVVPEESAFSKLTIGYTCGFLFDSAQTWKERSLNCQEAKTVENFCCLP